MDRRDAVLIPLQKRDFILSRIMDPTHIDLGINSALTKIQQIFISACSAYLRFDIAGLVVDEQFRADFCQSVRDCHILDRCFLK